MVIIKIITNLIFFYFNGSPLTKPTPKSIHDTKMCIYEIEM